MKPAETPPLTPIIAAYLAGFIDGDGTITIVNRGKSCKQFRPQIIVYNCNDVVVSFFEKYCGKAKIRLKKTGKCKEHINWRPVYEIIYTNQKAINIINHILPYLNIKKRQARLLLRYNKLDKKYSPVFKRWNPDIAKYIISIKLKLKKECNQLNSRGNKHKIVRRSLYKNEYLKNELFSYLAGFLDADGSFAICGKNFVPKINATNTCDIPIKILYNKYGGSLYIQNKKNRRWLDTNVVDITQRKAFRLIKDVLPFLIVKKQQAKILLAMIKLRNFFGKQGAAKRWNRPLYEKRIKIYNVLKKQCMFLNEKGKKNV